jgi:erythromycin esterase-like protein
VIGENVAALRRREYLEALDARAAQREAQRAVEAARAEERKRLERQVAAEASAAARSAAAARAAQASRDAAVRDELIAGHVERQVRLCQHVYLIRFLHS